MGVLYLAPHRGAIAPLLSHCLQSPGNILLCSWWNICPRSLTVLLWQLNNVITQGCATVAAVEEIVLFHFRAQGFLWGVFVCVCVFLLFPLLSLGKWICLVLFFMGVSLCSGSAKTKFKGQENNMILLLFPFSTRMMGKQLQTLFGLGFPRITFYFIFHFIPAVLQVFFCDPRELEPALTDVWVWPSLE